jgi:hypothetical protein
MKKIVIAALSIFALSYSADAQVTVENNKIEAVITPATSRQQLADMRTALLAHGLEMRYDQIQWNTQQELTAINVRVKGANTDVQAFATQNLMGDGGIRIVFRTDAPAASALCVSPSCE